MSKTETEKATRSDIKMAPRANGAPVTGATANATPAAPTTQPQLDPAQMEKLVAAQAKLQQTFGKITLALLTVPRYRHLALSDLQYLVLDPLFRDRIALAQPTNAAGVVDECNMVGFAIWANVSEDVDAKIREQITAGVFPLRLKPEDWTSGSINWLLDVVAPNAMLATAVLANLRQVIKDGDLRVHPLVAKLVDAEALKKMGINIGGSGATAAPNS